MAKQAAAELGYVPNTGAKQLVTRKSNLIGVFMPEFEFESPQLMVRESVTRVIHNYKSINNLRDRGWRLCLRS